MRRALLPLYSQNPVVWGFSRLLHLAVSTLILEAEVSQGIRPGVFLTLVGTPASKVALAPKLTLRRCGVASTLSPASFSRESRGAGSNNSERVAESFPSSAWGHCCALALPPPPHESADASGSGVLRPLSEPISAIIESSVRCARSMSNNSCARVRAAAVTRMCNDVSHERECVTDAFL